MLIPNSVIVFSNSIAKAAFLGKFGTETLKFFASNETLNIGVFKGADSELDNCFLKFNPKSTFLGNIWSRNFKVICVK